MQNGKDSLRNVLENFIGHVDDMESKLSEGKDLYNVEFQELKRVSEALKGHRAYSTRHGQLSVNRRKNRYKDILPFDMCRVVLKQREVAGTASDITASTASDSAAAVDQCDYINASYIRGASGSHAYIAAQGPLSHTVADFWRCVVECDVQIIIMACNQTESGKLKCDNYWPSEDTDCAVDYGGGVKAGGVSVKLQQTRRICRDFCIRKFLISYTGKNAAAGSDGGDDDGSDNDGLRVGSRQVYQFHYHAWPDHGVPRHVSSLLRMIRLVRAAQRSETLPLLVHCSAGCGRTGCVCAIDFTAGLLRSGKLDGDFSMFGVVAEMRKQRVAMVQTRDQYVLVHRAVRKLFLRHLRLIDSHIYENVPQAHSLSSLCGDDDGEDDGTTDAVSSEDINDEPSECSSSSVSSSSSSAECPASSERRPFATVVPDLPVKQTVSGCAPDKHRSPPAKPVLTPSTVNSQSPDESDEDAVAPPKTTRPCRRRVSTVENLRRTFETACSGGVGDGSLMRRRPPVRLSRSHSTASLSGSCGQSLTFICRDTHSITNYHHHRERCKSVVGAGRRGDASLVSKYSSFSNLPTALRGNVCQQQCFVQSPQDVATISSTVNLESNAESRISDDQLTPVNADYSTDLKNGADVQDRRNGSHQSYESRISTGRKAADSSDDSSRCGHHAGSSMKSIGTSAKRSSCSSINTDTVSAGNKLNSGISSSSSPKSLPRYIAPPSPPPPHVARDSRVKTRSGLRCAVTSTLITDNAFQRPSVNSTAADSNKTAAMSSLSANRSRFAVRRCHSLKVLQSSLSVNRVEYDPVLRRGSNALSTHSNCEQNAFVDAVDAVSHVPVNSNKKTGARGDNNQSSASGDTNNNLCDGGVERVGGSSGTRSPLFVSVDSDCPLREVCVDADAAVRHAISPSTAAAAARLAVIGHYERSLVEHSRRLGLNDTLLNAEEKAACQTSADGEHRNNDVVVSSANGGSSVGTTSFASLLSPSLVSSAERSTCSQASVGATAEERAGSDPGSTPVPPGRRINATVEPVGYSNYTLLAVENMRRIENTLDRNPRCAIYDATSGDQRRSPRPALRCCIDSADPVASAAADGDWTPRQRSNSFRQAVCRARQSNSSVTSAAVNRAPAGDVTVSAHDRRSLSLAPSCELSIGQGDSTRRRPTSNSFSLTSPPTPSHRALTVGNSVFYERSSSIPPSCSADVGELSQSVGFDRASGLQPTPLRTANSVFYSGGGGTTVDALCVSANSAFEPYQAGQKQLSNRSTGQQVTNFCPYAVVNKPLQVGASRSVELIDDNGSPVAPPRRKSTSSSERHQIAAAGKYKEDSTSPPAVPQKTPASYCLATPSPLSASQDPALSRRRPDANGCSVLTYTAPSSGDCDNHRPSTHQPFERIQTSTFNLKSRRGVRVNLLPEYSQLGGLEPVEQSNAHSKQAYI